MNQRLTRDERLSRQSDIDACYKKGQRLPGKLLRVHALANGRDVSRLAISIPRRVCGAVERNRWKRLIREAFRRNKPAIGPGVDLVVVPNRPPGELKRQDVEAVLLALLSRRSR